MYLATEKKEMKASKIWTWQISFSEKKKKEKTINFHWLKFPLVHAVASYDI